MPSHTVCRVPPAELAPDSGATGDAGIVARGVSKSFGGELALPPTDLRAAAGAVTLLTAGNGKGKTTMLRILATLVTPDTGTVHINGLDGVREGRNVRAQLGLALVNERSVFWRLTVLENLELFARVRGVPKKTRRDHCRAVLEELGLADFERRDAHALSAGQRQRVIVGRAFVGDPPVQLIDEPLRGLDEDAERLVLGALRGRAERGATVLVATPSVREYAPLNADAVATLGSKPGDDEAGVHDVRTTEAAQDGAAGTGHA